MKYIIYTTYKEDLLKRASSIFITETVECDDYIKLVWFGGEVEERFGAKMIKDTFNDKTETIEQINFLKNSVYISNLHYEFTIIEFY